MCFSPNIIQIIQPRILKWAGNVARLGKKQIYTGFWWGDRNESDDLEDLDAAVRIMLT
jgi:hypothetical protein